ncbi:MAG TPA: hypothetical protein VJ570_01825, partial [Holophagaceae bacterium]|nr:hypothetical protein [Holophagaceae bacterium]
MRSHLISLALLGALGLAPATPMRAQAPATAPGQTQAPNLKDLDAFVALLYTSISGPAGQKRDVELQKSLFLPGARLALPQRSKDGKIRIANLDVDGYCRSSFPFMEQHGFFEKELDRRVDRFGNLAQVWSAYESWEKEGGPKERGLNSFQLLFDGSRWWVTG